MTPAAPIKPPVQSRSRETLQRIYAAAESLMEETPFEKITVQQIVKRARTTTGSFYARFEDKDALLEALHAQHVSDMVELLHTRLMALPNDATELQVETIVEMIGSVFRLRPALMRSGTLKYWSEPVEVRTSGAQSDTHKKFAAEVRKLGAELVRIAETLGHAEAKTAGLFALKIALASSRQHYLFSDERTVLKTSSRDFERELTVMIYNYLNNGENRK